MGLVSNPRGKESKTWTPDETRDRNLVRVLWISSLEGRVTRVRPTTAMTLLPPLRETLEGRLRDSTRRDHHSLLTRGPEKEVLITTKGYF